MRILIVSYYFPPYNTIGAIRVGKFARYLTALGHDVRVVAANAPALEQNDASLQVEIDADRVIYTPWRDVNRLPRALAGLVQRARRQRNVSTSSVVTPTLHVLPRSIRAFAKLYISATNIPDAFFGWTGPAYRAAHNLIAAQPVDVILASGAPFSALLVARKVAREFGIPWVADLRDLWADKEPYPFVRARKVFDRWHQARILNSAAGIVTVSPPLAEALRRDGLVPPVEIIYNGFDPDDLPAPAQPSRTGPLLVRYAGSLYGDPDPLFLGVSLLPSHAQDVRVEFLLRGHAQTLLEAARRRRVADRVRILEPVPYRECLVFQSAADVLLLIQNEGPRWRGVVSGKIFEYLAAERPVLALSGQDSTVHQILAETGAGITSRDPQTIAAWLTHKVEQKRASGVPRTSSQHTSQFTRMAQTKRLESFLKLFVAAHD
ncbi:MAG: glycosyltransferase [Chloroflexi bacterium]|nr:glycosyltransferase [Chloroflexota bacterium]